MANSEHLAELKKGVASWNNWLRGNADLGRKGASGVNLTEADLSDFELVGVDLSGADLSKAKIDAANLSGANLRGVVGRGADFSGSNLSGSNLSGAVISGANLSESDLSGVIGRGADFSGSNLSDANLSDADLENANLNEVDFRRATLASAKLTGAALCYSNLSGANLSSVSLVGTKLMEANLSGANLTGASVVGAFLVGVDLSGADLSGADLEGAKFLEANLSGAILKRALCGDTVWTSVALHTAKHLSMVYHRGASSVGTDTLSLSKGRIPPEFLKGCGLADWEIESSRLYDPDLNTTEVTDIQYRIFDLVARSPIQISPVFVSYSHANAAFVDKLGANLDKVGVRHWRDIKDATAGRLDKVISRGISLNPTLLLVLSEDSINSDWVEFEIDRAVQLSKKLGRDVLCPIALDSSWFGSDRISGNLKAQIKKYNVLSFAGHHDDQAFETQFRKLIDGLGLHYRSNAGAVSALTHRI